MIESIPIGEKIEWDMIKKHNWELRFNNNIVASIKLKNYWKKKVEGSYDDIPVIIEKRISPDRNDILFIDMITRKEIGTLSIQPWKYLFTLHEGRRFFVFRDDLKGVYKFTDENENVLMFLWYNCIGQNTSTIKFLSIDENIINPWLMAMIGQYYAIRDGGVLNG